MISSNQGLTIAGSRKDSVKKTRALNININTNVLVCHGLSKYEVRVSPDLRIQGLELVSEPAMKARKAFRGLP